MSVTGVCVCMFVCMCVFVCGAHIQTSSCQRRRNYFHMWQNFSALLLVPLRVLVICNPAADHPQMPRNYVEQLYASCGEIPLPLDLQIFSSLYVLQQLFNTTKSQVFHAPPQDSVTQNSAHVLYSEKSVTGEQGLKSCHSPVNASRCLQPLLDCFTFWQYGRRNFSPPILHALTCKSQPEYWHLQTRVRVFHVFFTS